MLTPFGYFDLIDEMNKTGCPICNLLKRDVHKLLNTILYEYVTEPNMHATFRASRGLCNEHGWQLTELGNVMSIAVLYTAVLDELLKELEQTPTEAESTPQRARRLFSRTYNSNIVDALNHKVACPVCKKNAENELSFVTVFSDHLLDDNLQTVYPDCDGLCLEHFKQVLHHTSNLDASQFLIKAQRDIWRRLLNDLNEFVRKYDVNNADEAVGAEGDSWLRAVRQISGEKGVFGLRAESK